MSYIIEGTSRFDGTRWYLSENAPLGQTLDRFPLVNYDRRAYRFGSEDAAKMIAAIMYRLGLNVDGISART